MLVFLVRTPATPIDWAQFQGYLAMPGFAAHLPMSTIAGAAISAASAACAGARPGALKLGAKCNLLRTALIAIIAFV